MKNSSRSGRASTKVPASVRILGRTYTLRPDPKLIEEQGAYGLHYETQRLIEYDPGVSEIDLKDTVLHELIHGLDCLHKLGLTEHQVTLLATGLTAMLDDNPDLSKFLLT